VHEQSSLQKEKKKLRWTYISSEKERGMPETLRNVGAPETLGTVGVKL
jgi:hypothetical protein